MKNGIGTNSTRLGISFKDAPTTVSGRLAGETLRAFQTIAHLSSAKHSRIVEYAFRIAAGLLPPGAMVVDLILTTEALQSAMLDLAQAQQHQHALGLLDPSSSEVVEVKAVDVQGVTFETERLKFWGTAVLVFQDETGVAETDRDYMAWLTIDREFGVEFVANNVLPDEAQAAEVGPQRPVVGTVPPEAPTYVAGGTHSDSD